MGFARQPEAAQAELEKVSALEHALEPALTHAGWLVGCARSLGPGAPGPVTWASAGSSGRCWVSTVHRCTVLVLVLCAVCRVDASFGLWTLDSASAGCGGGVHGGAGGCKGRYIFLRA